MRQGHLTAMRTVAITLCAIAADAGAGWTVMNLGPPGTTSVAHATTATYQVGVSFNQASFWTGTAASVQKLDPNISPVSGSVASGVGGDWAVGWYNAQGTKNAHVWDLTTGAYTNLNPGGFGSSVTSELYDTTGTEHVGVAHYNAPGGTVASIWIGTSLVGGGHPPGSPSRSTIYATTGSQRAGYATFSSVDHAGIWTGTTGSSWQDLHPAAAGATGSNAYDTTGAHQAGYAEIGGAHHAGMWSGTAASWVDLHPAGASASEARGIDGIYQVGWATFGGNDHAGLWTGGPGTWVDLHSVLPTGVYDSSQALGICVDGADIYVCGFAMNGTWSEAMLWQIPEPATVSLLGLGAVAFILRRHGTGPGR